LPGKRVFRSRVGPVEETKRAFATVRTPVDDTRSSGFDTRLPTYLFREHGIRETLRRVYYYRISTGYLVELRTFLRRNSHVDSYRKWMAYKISKAGSDAIGTYDSEIGDGQHEFLVEEGLSTENTMLDIGCGALRGGKRFIDYLEPGRYTGMDINENIIELGKENAADELLRSKEPTLLVNDDLRSRELDDPFDFILAQNVFTHLPQDEIEECLANVDRVMHSDSVFYATFAEGKDPTSFINYGYAPEELVSMAADHDLEATALPEEAYPHPEGQRMLRIERS
jgi:hypothetical protein